MSSLHAKLTGLTVIIAAVVLAYAHLLLGGQTMVGRHLSELLPALDHMSASIGAGRIPEWWDGIGLGVAFAANSTHAALYPPAWLTAVLPMPWAADFLLLGHLVLAGAGTTALAQKLGADRFGAVSGGAAFAVCGAMTVAMPDAGAVMPLAWMPWIGWAALGVADASNLRERVRTGAVLAMLGAVQFHAGGMEAISAAAVLAAALAAYRARSVIPFLALAASFTASLLLAAAAVVPEIFLNAADPGGPAPWSRLAELVIPTGASLPSAYMGTPLVFLACLGASQCKRSAPLGGMVIGFALLGALVGRAHLVSAAIILCVLAAQALSLALLATPSRRRALLGAAGAGLYAIVILAVVVVRDGDVERSLSAVFVLLLIVVGLWVASAEHRRRHGVALLSAVLIGHLVSDVWNSLPRTSRAAISERPALLPPAKAESPSALRPRIYRPRSLPRARTATEDDPVYRHLVLRPNSAARFGYAHLRGIDRAQPPALERVWNASAIAGERMLDLFGVELALLPASVVLRTGMPVAARAPGHPLVLVHNRERRARAFVAPAWIRKSDDGAVQSALFPPAGRSPLRLGTIHLVGDPADSAPSRGLQPSPPCSIESERPELVHLRCPRTNGGYAVLLDAFAAGWSASVNGKAASIERADLLVRAVRVGEGAHEVVFHYRTPGLRLGAIIAMLSWLNLLALFLVVRRRGPPTA